ncbi:ComEC/Rec2 family competence protein [Cytophaga hutchinsonii]|uniref:Zn-dependent hydrolase n=1 Tax=Cytophaga hutchinsonii (strain ATCC 33406 / DSM 1761 / CIP 103989 / NBRC 15051 / NCIMB 9469 / D465) TaxID=269798 RepID=A0A6N4SM59_CYTH3|nr:MBL fold metallo-hydrolase [Cytophaga hutchinsonii]ABG57331.1 Zn-dependent hydrolase [Cytophaga hutchinsonii ATCC 33406]SFX46525.1 Metal-dependent hydrolase, beta-lactamase superfamily II [Cytophaga hutchinsonii ATCC 33406]
MKIKFLKAFNGDSILISFAEDGKSRNILIDGGMPATYVRKGKNGKPEYGELKSTIDAIRERDEKIDLLILTHVDNDHIGGLLKWFEKDQDAYKLIGRIWFNSGKLISEFFNQKENEENFVKINPDESTLTSIRGGVTFEDYIETRGIWDRRIVIALEYFEYLGINFKILSPSSDKLKLLLGKWEKEAPKSLYTSPEKNDYELTLNQHIENDKFEEDTTIHNGSSIAFIITFENKNFVFLADAHPTIVANSLKELGYSNEKPLKAELVKISHHGSKANNSIEMLKLITTNKYLISTNGDKDAHPNKQLLARLASINDSCEVYFNYPGQIEKIFKPEDRADFPNFKPVNMEDNEFTF